MSVKDFEPVFSTLNTEFVDLKSKVDTLINKYKDLEKQLKKQKKFSFKCNQCKKKFESIKELQDHKKEEGSCESNFKCDECGKTFRNKKQLEVHEKKHQKFECDECDCEFSYEGLLERHTEAVHGDMKIFCHYFNNDKDCPFDEECIFAHEDSRACKFGNGCERMMCMFQHEKSDEDDDDESDDDDGDDDDHNNAEDSLIQVRDLEPSIKKVEEAMEKVNVLLKKHSSALKCDLCEFEARNTNGLTMHKKVKHTDNNK